MLPGWHPGEPRRRSVCAVLPPACRLHVHRLWHQVHPPTGLASLRPTLAPAVVQDVEEASQSAAAADASSDAAAAAEQAWARATAAALAWEKEAAAAKAAMLKAQQASREAAAARDEVLESAAQARGCSACCLWWVGSLGIDDQHFLYINRNVLATLIQVGAGVGQPAPALARKSK